MIWVKMVGRAGFEPAMYLTSRIYSPLASPICISTRNYGTDNRNRTYANGFGDHCSTIELYL